MAYAEDIPTEEAPSPADILQSIIDAESIVEMLDEQTLTEIGADVVSNFDSDKSSMSDWLGKMEKAIDLAQMVKEDKTYPFEKASNIKYPLVASAALQFNARAYPAIVPSDSVVKCKTWGRDPQGQKAARGKRVADYMSWQLSVEVEEWEDVTDKMLVVLPIVGDEFRKVWYDGERARCRAIDSGKFIFDNNCSSFSLLPRCSEELSLYPYEITERVNDGRFAEAEIDQTEEDRKKQTPETFIEQHTRIDLDGDGYPEPYVVTVHKDTEKVVRIAPDFRMEDVRFEMETVPVPVEAMGPYGSYWTQETQEVPTAVLNIKRGSYFVHFQFMPGMGKGILGTGLGILLGDLSAAINTSFNMLIDAGHYASMGGGFIGSEFRLKGGAQRMRPGEWAKVPATGQDIRQSIVPMTFPGPNETLFAMLGMMVEAGKEIASIQDVLTGDTGGRNMTATTTLALIEQGLKVFTASYKRIFRSLKREYRIFATINAETVAAEKYNAFLDDMGEDGQPIQHDPKADFGAADMDVQPVSDPNSVTKMQEMAKAQLLDEMSDKGKVDPAEATRRILTAASIDDIDALLPQPDPAMMQKQAAMDDLQFEDIKAGLELKQVEIQRKLTEIEEIKAGIVLDVEAADTDKMKAENDAMKTRLEAMTTMLEDRRENIRLAIERSDRRMEGAPGN